MQQVPADMGRISKLSAEKTVWDGVDSDTVAISKG
jgi:hypothetical protein